MHQSIEAPSRVLSTSHSVLHKRTANIQWGRLETEVCVPNIRTKSRGLVVRLLQ